MPYSSHIQNMYKEIEAGGRCNPVILFLFFHPYFAFLISSLYLCRFPILNYSNFKIELNIQHYILLGIKLNAELHVINKSSYQSLKIKKK